VEGAVAEAVSHARAGKGPSIVEALTERLVGHYTGDIEHYRPKGEVEAARQREPLVRLKAWLGDTAAYDAAVDQAIEDALARALRVPPPDPTTALEHLYA
jgi:TPP-dependent pyruvate/acetoin dehydrogenase alpha subunit